MFPICHLERMKKLKRLKVHFCEKVYFIFFTLVRNKAHFLPKVPKTFFLLKNFFSFHAVLQHSALIVCVLPPEPHNVFWSY